MPKRGQDWNAIARVDTYRIGAEHAGISWTWKNVSSSRSMQEDLYVQVVPVKSEEEERRQVVDTIFSRISSSLTDEESVNDFIPMHTSANGQIIHFQVTEQEQKGGQKQIRLIPNYTYEISLGLITSERYIQRSNVSRIRLGFIVLSVLGSGELSRANKGRKVGLGESTLQSRNKQLPFQKSISQGCDGETSAAEAQRKKFMPAKWHSKGVKSSGSDAEDFSESWFQTPGISITALDMEDLEPVYHRCFQTYGYKDAFVSSSAVAELMTELSEVGTISHVKGLSRKHLWILTTSVGWEVSNSFTKLGELLETFILDLGASVEDAERLSKASLLRESGSGKGCRPFAFVGISPRSSTTAFSMPSWVKNNYLDAKISIALSFDDDNWFPTFKKCGEHWQVWTAPVHERLSGRKLERVGTSKDLKLRRNNIVINELEGICKYFSPSGASGVPFDLTAFLHIVFDMIRGYSQGSNSNSLRDVGVEGALWKQDRTDDDTAPEREGKELGIHDPSLCPVSSRKAFTHEVASLSSQLETVLSKLLSEFKIGSQLIEAGVVEFLISRISRSTSKEATMNSLWLLISLACEDTEIMQSPRQYSADGCPLLLSYSKKAQPRLLPEIYRRGGVLAASTNFKSSWTDASTFGNFQMLHKLSFFMLHVAEMKSATMQMKFSYKESSTDTDEIAVVNALQSRLPLKERGLSFPRGKVVVAALEYMENQFEPEKCQAWGPGWANSGELLIFSEASSKTFCGNVVLIPASKDWKEHCALVLQSCRLVWLAACAGAVGVIFVWPGPLVQQMYPNLNFSMHSEIPSYIVPQSDEIKAFCEGLPADLVECSLLYSSADTEQLLEFKFTKEDLHPIAHQLGVQFSTCLKQILAQVPKVYEDPKRPIRILSLDGGGVKGISTICMLKHIIERIEEELKDDPCDLEQKTLAHFFDLVVGTSAGGIIAMGLGSGMPLDDIEAFYDHSVHEIFGSKDSYWDQLQRGPGASAARRLQEIIKSEWPERTPTSSSADSTALSIPFQQHHKDLGCLPGVCMLSTLVSREPSRTCMLKSYISDPEKSIAYLPEVHRATILQCIRATSAAPYYLEELLCHKDICTGEFFSDDVNFSNTKQGPFHLEPVLTTYRFVDGAISVNNPTCAAILEAQAIYPGHPLVVVSLGTGNGLARVPVKTYPSGIGVVLQNLISSTADVSISDSLAEHMLTDRDNYFRFCPSGDVFNCDMGSNDKKIIDIIRGEATSYMKSPIVQHKLKNLTRLLCQRVETIEEQEGS